MRLGMALFSTRPRRIRRQFQRPLFHTLLHLTHITRFQHFQLRRPRGPQNQTAEEEQRGLNVNLVEVVPDQFTMVICDVREPQTSGHMSLNQPSMRALLYRYTHKDASESPVPALLALGKHGWWLDAALSVQHHIFPYHLRVFG